MSEKKFITILNTDRFIYCNGGIIGLVHPETLKILQDNMKVMSTKSMKEIKPVFEKRKKK